jgi:hypothetical protein
LEWHCTKYTKKVDLFSKKYLTETGITVAYFDESGGFWQCGVVNGQKGWLVLRSEVATPQGSIRS